MFSNTWGERLGSQTIIRKTNVDFPIVHIIFYLIWLYRVELWARYYININIRDQKVKVPVIPSKIP